MRVLLVVDAMPWVFGTIAREIVRAHPEIAFRFASTTSLRNDPSRLAALAADCDVVHWIDPSAALDHAGRIAAPREPAHVVSIHHLRPAFQDVRHLEAWSKLADGFTVASQQWRGWLAGHGIETERLHRVPYGVDVERFRPVPDRRALRRRLGLPEDTFLVGFFGKATSNLDDRKGTDVLREVLARLAATGRVALVAVGPGWDTRAGDLGGARLCRRELVGPALLPDLHAALDTYLVTARQEGGPVTLLESMACGVPVVATPVGIASEVITNAENGILAPGRFDATNTLVEDAQRPAWLADAVDRLRVDPELRASLGRRARERMLEQRWERVLAPLPDVYAAALARRGRSAERVGATDLAAAERQQNRAGVADEIAWLADLARQGVSRAARSRYWAERFADPEFRRAARASGPAVWRGLLGPFALSLRGGPA